MQLQKPQGNMMWKAELMRRQGFGRSYSAWGVGGEYTISRSSGDLGLLAEWYRDFRDTTVPSTLFGKAAALGVRYRLADSSDSELLLQVVRPVGREGWLFRGELNWRIDDRFTVGVLARKFNGIDGPEAAMRRDGGAFVTVRRHFE